MPETIPADHFRCALCKKVCPKYDDGWTEERALAELAVCFPGTPVEECDVVCDDCWAKIHPNRN